jgi:DNA-binding winged helix-turn-helix (wHTH) protein
MHTHPLVDYARHGVKSFRGDTSIYLSETRFRLLSTLAFFPPGTVVPYSTIAAVVWPGAVSDPYDGSYNHVIQAHLFNIRALMTHDGAWPHNPFEVRNGVGICINAALLPMSCDNLTGI